MAWEESLSFKAKFANFTLLLLPEALPECWKGWACSRKWKPLRTLCIGLGDRSGSRSQVQYFLSRIHLRLRSRKLHPNLRRAVEKQTINYIRKNITLHLHSVNGTTTVFQKKRFPNITHGRLLF